MRISSPPGIYWYAISSTWGPCRGVIPVNFWIPSRTRITASRRDLFSSFTNDCTASDTSLPIVMSLLAFTFSYAKNIAGISLRVLPSMHLTECQRVLFEIIGLSSLCSRSCCCSRRAFRRFPCLNARETTWTLPTSFEIPGSSNAFFILLWSMWARQGRRETICPSVIDPLKFSVPFSSSESVSESSVSSSTSEHLSSSSTSSSSSMIPGSPSLGRFTGGPRINYTIFPWVYHGSPFRNCFLHLACGVCYNKRDLDAGFYSHRSCHSF